MIISIISCHKIQYFMESLIDLKESKMYPDLIVILDFQYVFKLKIPLKKVTYSLIRTPKKR
jgi:hypothetical protein